MKSLIFAPLLVVLAGLAGAQTSSPDSKQSVSMRAQRTVIATERAKLEAGFSQEEALCYSRFAVNNCLDNVNTRRRQAMDELRRQEVLLNDQERKSRGEAQIRKIQEKSSPEKRQEAAQRRARAAEDYQLRLEHGKKRQQDNPAISSSQAATRDAHARKLMAHQEKALARAKKQSTAAEEAKKFNDRQKEAQARKARRQAEQRKQSNPAAKPLPVPELSR